MPLCYKVCSCYAASISLQSPMSKSSPNNCFSLKIQLLAHYTSLPRLRSFCYAYLVHCNELVAIIPSCLSIIPRSFFLGFVIISELCWKLQCWSHPELTTISTNNSDFSSPPTTAASVFHSIIILLEILYCIVLYCMKDI